MNRFLPRLICGCILIAMLLAAVFLLQTSTSLSDINRLATAKDVAGLTKLVTSLSQNEINPFEVLKTGGAYDVGRFGWTALDLSAPSTGEKYVVIGTKLTSEDVGEILLKRDGSQLKYVLETNSMGISVLHHSFDVKFDVPNKSVSIVDQFQFDPGKQEGDFLFRMSPNYRVDSIKNDGKSVPFSQSSGVVFVPRPKATATYSIAYHGVVDLPNYAGSISSTEASLANDYWYPMIARQPSPYDVTVHAPKDWLVVGQGVQQMQSQGEAKFKMDLPVVYFSLSAGPYKTFGQKLGERDFRLWSPRLTEEKMRIGTELYRPIIKFYSDNFGTYPFPQWGALDSPTYGGGALEAYSYATYGGGLPQEDAHEPAHTWWGGILNNTYLGSFWNESFAVYSDGLYHREGFGNAADRREAFATQGYPSENYNNRAIEGSSAFTGPIGSSLGYGKGAQVLAMLEEMIGTKQMIATMHEWVALDHGKAVDWPDFEAVAIKMNPSHNLKSFFDDWLRKPGYADLDITNYKFGPEGISFHVGYKAQSYRIPLTILVEHGPKDRVYTTIDLKATGDYKIPCKTKPTLVSFDPWLQILRKIDATERLDTFNSLTRNMGMYRESTSNYLSTMGGQPVTALPSSLENVFIIGHPDRVPAMKPLLALAGFAVVGDELTYKGTKVNLNHGGAVAVLTLAGGAKCAIGLGKTLVRPNLGFAQVAVFDDYGRILASHSEPKTKGRLVF